MATMGNYCRAYYTRDFAAFDGWHPDLSQLRPAVGELDGREVHVQRNTLADDDILYLQENFAVTDGIFLDEHVVFAGAGPEWEAFCTGELGFAPDVEAAAEEPAEEPAAA